MPIWHWLFHCWHLASRRELVGEKHGPFDPTHEVNCTEEKWVCCQCGKTEIDRFNIY